MITLCVMESPETETNGDRMRAARQREGLTLEGLGKQLIPEQNKQQIHKLENNQVKIRPPMARQLADILGGSPLDYVDPEYAGATSLAGASDKGRQWEGAAAHPKLRRAAFKITASQLRDVVVSLVRSYAGDAAADRVTKLDFTKPADDLSVLLFEEEGDVSFHLTRYLLTAAAAASSIPPDDPRYDFPRWLESAQRAAELLLSLASHGKSDGPRKSG